MANSLLWLVSFLAVFGTCFVGYLVLSTCLGPPLVRAFRSWLNTHYRAVNAREWDQGGAGYRQAGAARRGRFVDGTGGSEGYEMATMTAQDD
ncbi:hypothetical protein BMF94_3441 [Rhodotorula taiwanensis]|uniref:Uncharacterized protein n=1 Tax=Rhodotorula taiwanensis TaxID=741276 RepID=A0A2S5B9Q7_9BASI|nr:hypothetical protein BMF94_3441 [Rhodotorula taiwanensis]